MDIIVKEVETHAELKKFVRFPTKLYRGNKFYVHPLDLDELNMLSPKNPSWEQVTIKMFLAFRGKEIVGRLAVLIQNLYNEINGKKCARFTRFDFIDDKDVAFALLDAGCAFAREQGMEVIHGPLGFNDLDKEGLLVEGFDKLSTFSEMYNYGYYKTHIEKYGFEKEIDWIEFVIKVPKCLDERVVKISERMKDRLGLSFLPPKMSLKKVLALYGDKLFDLLNTCYEELHGVVPITEKVRASLLKQFKQILRREHVCIVFKGEDVIGLGLTAPNISRSLNKSQGRLCNFGFIPWNGLRIKKEARWPKYVDLCLVAVAPEWRGKGINAIMMTEMFGNLVKNKIISVETNLQLENNTSMINMFDGYERELVKRRRCYVKNL